ncbi:MAG: SulP family inorganic anion transporter [Cytophagaceae bacterium]|jgi:MFS superfamily sulfate permease-like transporter|nr:SulP family inorganic anion transporter [Cytophagaceae bacterium]
MFSNFKQYWKSDLISGFLVFLIALPLCLGISKASGFPPIAGLYTAIIGGLMVSFIGGSHLTIKGPAAGLIVIALGCIEELGRGNLEAGYQLALAVIMVSGLLQIVLGLFRSGIMVDFMPSAAIHGMLASIGIIIASKQIHIALGVKPESKEAIELIKEIPHSIAHLNPELACIGIISILILFTLPKIKLRYAKLIPGPLLVLMIAIPLGLFFNLHVDHDYEFANSIYHLDHKEILVNLPDSFIPSVFPDFSQITSFTSIKYIIMFLLVGSIESLLGAKAIDGLDPMKRKSNLNKDLVAVGVGNTLAGLVGGLPMICEIVRSSANINNGAKSPWSNFFHAFFLLVAVVFAAPLIRMIPNAALAAMLIFTGYRLASPDEFKKTLKIGPDQLVIFLSTMVVTLATDLLIGIAFGILVKFLQHIFLGAPLSTMFKTKTSVEKVGENHYQVKLEDAAVFTNFISFKKKFDLIPKNAQVDLDLSKAIMIDHTFMEHIHDYEDQFTNHGGFIAVTGLENLTPYSTHPLSARKLVNDAIFAPTKIIYNNRQQALSDLANKHALNFDHRRTSSILKFRFAPFHIAQRAQYGQNMLMGHGQHCNFFFADILIEEGAMMTKTDYRMTILLVTDLACKTPDFILEKTGALDILKDIGGSKDINFDKYPDFSKDFYLEGRNEQEVRAFFNHRMLQFFEREKGYYIESHNNVLLIHKRLELLEPIEIEDSIRFLNNFMNIAVEEAAK